MVNDTKAKQKRSTSEKLLFVLFILSVIANMFMVVELSYERQENILYQEYYNKSIDLVEECIGEYEEAVVLVQDYDKLVQGWKGLYFDCKGDLNGN